MTATRRARLGQARLYLVAPGPDGDAAWLETLLAAVAGGAEVVQLRMKGAPTARVRAALERTRQALGPDVLLLVNDDLAAVHDDQGHPLADGLHLGREDAASLAASDPAGPSLAGPGSGSLRGPDAVAAGLALARARLGPDLLLGTSTRHLAEIDAAVAAGADHVGFGAMAPSTTKADTAPADPVELARCVRARPAVPIFPIGGLGPANLSLVLRAGCGRAAIGAAIVTSPDPRAAARACRLLLDQGPGLP